MNKTLKFTVRDAVGTPRTTVVSVSDGTAGVVHLETPYLVAAGQSMQFTVEVGPERGEPVHQRALAEVLVEAIQHGRDNPTHGTNCACLDGLLRELKRQILGVLPTSVEEPDWERRIDARSRVIYLLRAASRYL